MQTLRAIPSAIAKGFSEWQTMLVLLWLTLLCGAIVMVPDLAPLLKTYGHAPLAEGKPLISPELLLGLSQAFPRGTNAFSTLNIAMLIAIPFTLFLTGGVVWRAWTVDLFRLSEFIAESARMFGRTLRTLLWSLLLLAVCLGLSFGASALLHLAHHDTLFSAPGASWVLDRPLTGWAFVHLLFAGLLWALWRMTLDVSRVLVLVEEMRKTRRAVWRAFKLVLRAPGACAAYALLGLVEVCAVLLMVRVHGTLPEGNTALAWLAMLVAQFVVLMRAGFQVSSTAFAADFVRRARVAATAAAPVSVVSPIAPVAAPGSAGVASADTANEPFELLASKPLPRSGSTSEMPMVDADLVDEEPRGGGSGPV